MARAWMPGDPGDDELERLFAADREAWRGASPDDADAWRGSEHLADWPEASVGPGSDVEQQVGVAARRPNEIADQLTHRLEAAVGDVEAPRIVHRQRSLEGQRSDLLGIEAGGVGAREILLERLDVLTRERRPVVIGHDERGGLQAMDQRVGAGQPPLGIGLVPHAVEPDAADRTVATEQFGQLAVHEIQIACPVAALGPVRVLPRPAAQPIVGTVPVELRVVEEQLQALPLALARTLLQRVALDRRRVSAVLRRRARREHVTYVVLAGSN